MEVLGPRPPCVEPLLRFLAALGDQPRTIEELHFRFTAEHRAPLAHMNPMLRLPDRLAALLSRCTR